LPPSRETSETTTTTVPRWSDVPQFDSIDQLGVERNLAIETPPTSEVPLLRAGAQVGDYRIVEPIGRGGMGVVYRATHPELGNAVAVKVLNDVWDPAAVARFKQEARLISQLRHPSIVQAFAFGTLADGRCYYVMDYLEGCSLKELLATDGRLEVQQAIALMRALAEALSAVHAKGIVHRDLKPANVFLLAVGGIKLLDFGIAKLARPRGQGATITQTGKQPGTPRYMSPEQARGVAIDHRSDIYSLGLLTFECLTGVAPFGKGAPGELIMHHQVTAPPPPSTLQPDLEAALDSPILRALSKDPNNRQQDALLFANELARAIGLSSASQVHGTRPPLPRSSPVVRAASVVQDGTRSLAGAGSSPSRMKRLLLLSALVAAGAVAITLLVATGRQNHAPQSEPQRISQPGSMTGSSAASTSQRVHSASVEHAAAAHTDQRAAQRDTHDIDAGTRLVDADARQLDASSTEPQGAALHGSGDAAKPSPPPALQRQRRRQHPRRRQHQRAKPDEEGSLIRF
jgi:serine/threonine protein kinase